MALFGSTARDWSLRNPSLKGNMRDYADIAQLICLSNLENLNAVFIEEGRPQSQRLERLNKIAIAQMKILTAEHAKNLLSAGDDEVEK
jgi:hypothetical protein